MGKEMEDVYTRSVATPENALAFLIDYFHVLKEEEPLAVSAATKAILALHTVQANLEEINRFMKPKMS